MVRFVSMIAGLVLAAASVPARATDFTGFYAGVNAGYGWEREKSATKNHAGPGIAVPDARAADALPPSASAAAAALNRPSPARP
jgi:hypothetical protein